MKKQTRRFASKGPFTQSYSLSSSHVQMWELDHEKGQEPKNWRFQIVLEKTLESPLDGKETKPVSPRGNQPWICIARTDAEAPILRPLDLKNWLTGKDPDSGKGWGQEERGTTDDEMVGRYRRLSTWVWANSGRQWRTGKPGMLESMGWQGVRHDLVTEQHHLRSHHPWRGW